jgi:uncharacterized membrane protein
MLAHVERLDRSVIANSAAASIFAFITASVRRTSG